MDKILYAGFVSGLIRKHGGDNQNTDNVERMTNTRKNNRTTSTLAAQRAITAAIAIRQGITPSSYDLRR